MKMEYFWNIAPDFTMITKNGTNIKIGYHLNMILQFLIPDSTCSVLSEH